MVFWAVIQLEQTYFGYNCCQKRFFSEMLLKFGVGYLQPPGYVTDAHILVQEMCSGIIKSTLMKQALWDKTVTTCISAGRCTVVVTMTERALTLITGILFLLSIIIIVIVVPWYYLKCITYHPSCSSLLFARVIQHLNKL